MKIGKKTMKRGSNATNISDMNAAIRIRDLRGPGSDELEFGGVAPRLFKKIDEIIIKSQGGGKRKSKKSKKTKKGRGSYGGGKKKCPKHCHRKTRRTRKGLKHRKN